MANEDYLDMVNSILNPLREEIEKEDSQKIQMIGSQFLELHTSTIGNPILVNVDQIAVVGETDGGTDGGTMITLSTVEDDTPVTIYVRETYEQIKSTLKFLFRR